MSTESTQKIRRSSSEVATLVTEFQQSGLNMRAFCSSRSLPVSTLSSWLRNTRKQQGGSASPCQPEPHRLIPVLLSQDSKAKQIQSPWLELVLKNQRTVKVYQSVDAGQLRLLLEAIEAL